MKRMSSLPMAEKCGKASELCQQYGSGRPAAMSTAFHATCAGSPRAKHLMAALTPTERDEVESWQKPGTVLLGDDALDYESAEKELEVGLDVFGDFTSDVKQALAWGHLDFTWMRGDIAYVADIKKTVWTTADGPESLQLHAYARAFALKHNCKGYVTGIWAATEGEWMWAERAVKLSSPEGEAILERIMFAASNEGEASTGDHCRSCFARLHCPEYVLPAAAADTWLAPFAQGDREITSDEAAEVLRRLEQMKDLREHVLGDLQELVRRGKVVVKDANGFKWKPIKMPGRESVDTKKLRAELGEAKILPFVKVGREYEQFRWVRR